MPKSKLIYFILLLFSLIFSSCNFPGSDKGTPTTDPIVALTGAALTVESKLATAQANTIPDGPTSTLTFFTPIPTTTSAPQQPTNTNPAPSPFTLCDAAYYLKDVTIPDGTEFSPGESFTKTWELRNDGTCTWTDEYGLSFDGSDTNSAQMSGPDFQVFDPGTSVSSAQTIEISVDLIAPSTPGTHRGNWRLRNADGTDFGLGGTGPFWVEIVVLGPTLTPSATDIGPTSTPTNTKTPAPSVSFSKSYVGTTTCSAQDVVVFKVSNTGDVDLQSINVVVEAPAGSQIGSLTDSAPFHPVGGGVADICSSAGADLLTPSSFAWIKVDISSIPTPGDAGKAFFKLCTIDGLGGLCTSLTLDFTW